jgi:ssDNA-binding Zn-finger/Zn-ribbon topoisomerase 1
MLKQAGQPARCGKAPDPRAVEQLLEWRRKGAKLRVAASIAGVHVATVCRWQKRDPALRQALAEAAKEARDERRRQGRPLVPWHSQCPLCQAKVVVRTTGSGRRFWRCGRWPQCEWASWRPRYPRNCKRCGGPCFWSHSRKSSTCRACGLHSWRYPNG